MSNNIFNKSFLITTLFYSVIMSQSIKILNLKLDSSCYTRNCENILLIDTLKYDSTFYCQNDTCLWNYSIKLDTVRSEINCIYTIKYQLSFDLFDAENSEVILYGALGNGMSGVTYREVIADSTTGDTLTYPGYGKKITVNIKSPSPSYMYLILYAKRIDGSDSTKSSTSGSFSSGSKYNMVKVTKNHTYSNRTFKNVLLNGKQISIDNKKANGFRILNDNVIIKK